MITILIAVGGAVIGAAVGSGLTWLLGAGDRKRAKQLLKVQEVASRAQIRVTELEAERNRVDSFLRFQPRTRVLGDSGSQIVRLESDEPFEVDYVEYLNARETKVASEPVDRSGAIIDVPINQSFLAEIRRVGPYFQDYDMSAEVIFRFSIRKSGLSKLHTHKGLIKPTAQNVLHVIG